MIKKLRKFNHMTILCISEDMQFRDDLLNNFKDCKNIIFSDSIEDEFDEKFDLLLVDYVCNNSIEIMDKIKIKHTMVPKIVIIPGEDDDVLLSCINRSVVSILKSPVDFDNLKLSMIVALNQSKRADKIVLNEGLYYDAYRERFYNNDGAISFTKFEFKVLKLLLDNHDQIISYDYIKEQVWKEKKMSIFTMRNVINKIRNKTYYNIIRNNSSKGYQIDSLN
ncbi:MAG: winged helix-turn-helix domain-containing protein [Campylobacterota bacterium]|nr:winged helix-turn-helix domain-containing protein [Campylobacterota bacterium]